MVMKADSQAVDDYIATDSHEKTIFLLALKRIIKESLPNSREGLAWSMPSYWQGSYLIHF